METPTTKKILFFDTETTGFVLKNKPIEEQPHLVQFWYILWEYHRDGTVEKETSGDLFFNPGVPIPKGASDVHGITDEVVADKPPVNEEFLRLFTALVRTADIVVCHNVEYDRSVLFFEIDRIYPLELTPGKTQWKDMFCDKQLCTMLASCELVGIKNAYGWKYPKLYELHRKLFWEGFDNAHNAMADIEATKKCFFELKRRELI